MLTKDDGTETLYDLYAPDIDAWGKTHEIRHHRAKRERNPIHRALGLLTILFAVTMLHAAGSPSRTAVPQTGPELPLSVGQTQGVPEVTPAVDTTDDRPQGRASRTAARPPMPPEPSPIEKVISWAMAQQGKRYVFGADGPNSFDCSGLVMQAFAQVGIKLPHYTGSMIRYGTKVSKKDLKRGDILFPTSGHVVIYLGDGMQLAASSGKGKVVVQKVYGFYAARRLL